MSTENFPSEEDDHTTVGGDEIDSFLSSPSRRGKEIYSARELESKSKIELISIILDIQKRGSQNTAPIGSEPAPTMSPDFETEVTEFQMLPDSRTIRIEDKSYTSWKIILYNSEAPERPLGLELYAEISVGRVSRETTPDFDLTLHGGALKGVSREHALLRPTKEALLVADLGSTNGTFVNDQEVVVGETLPVQDGDTLSFAQLHFTVKIVQSPPEAQ